MIVGKKCQLHEKNVKIEVIGQKIETNDQENKTEQKKC
jgi:hypothetical protein